MSAFCLRIHHAGWLAFALLPPAASNAAEDPESGLRGGVLRMTEFFDTMLPGTLGKRNFTLKFTPKFGDFRKYEYIRFPLKLRYGLGERWDLTGGIIPFIPNPFKSGADQRWGPGEITLGALYDSGAWRNIFDDTTVGVETRVPVGNPPIILNDHFTHVKPVAFATRKLMTWPDTTFYINASYDRSFELSRRGAVQAGVVRQNIVEVVPGLLYKPSQFGWFGEYRFRHFSEEPVDRLANQIKLGTIWDIPLARSEKWRLPGKWQLELAYWFSVEDGYGNDHGLSTRVSWRTTLREVLKRETEKSRKAR